LRIALFHHLPLAGGAIRVLVEYVAHSPQHDFTLYTRRTEETGLVDIPSCVRIVRRPAPNPRGLPGRLRFIWTLPRSGRALAAEIDAGGHDAVFCHSSELVQSPEVLPYLRTPTLYYAPEPLRAAYESTPSGHAGMRERLTAAGLNPYERRRKSLDRRHMRAAQRVVTHSRFTAERLRAIYGATADVVPLGVDSTVFSPSEVPRERFVLSVGALNPLKGHQFVVESVAAMPEPRPPVVVVADRGAYGPDLRRLAERLEVALEIRSGLPLEEVVDLYRRAGALACAQFREPFGLITLEGMATRTPVVAVAEGGLAETVTDGVTGLLTPRDSALFGQAINRVLADGKLARRLGDSGRREAVTRWTWDRTARGFDALLERCIAGAG
jgi:glycosyltransferase involved in cell wall biosynthesis